jgi:hypothetical protein
MRRILIVLIAAAASAVLLFAAFARQDVSSNCVLAPESARPLDLSIPADARHLTGDLARAAAAAARYKERVRQEPMQSDSVDARRNHGSRPDRAYSYCLTMLKRQIARTHSVPLN